ncbi:branched-chain amino acid ABC transporter permease [Varunaivibrio sulfuroxidans]|uniref:Amino acid/amide ABC transporter membrane protein 1 (HAAT family) n=1 Tax=Varunaivibrio sulfuroxidans TaxID=1773489 RepID=A0A4V2UP04_9PROT|nr:branched-chain amino acid ABC transporter permease [Varunaivibrio sulfuroxidans]TCS64051.1 amino acid/amide ABC transporter membrane protein 1 (HAAT family) [Varunaivibrio sulfuroxidans]WES31498.1 branched-chain amino acid ABC transporter permease [Varunaivibrio sulfuroxidans]
MELPFYLIQALNGVQYGLLLFLTASGLTLIFGVMGVINLAHGAFYMIGAYLAYWLSLKTGSFPLALVLATPITVAAGYLIERVFISRLYRRDHLDQVLLTYGLILILSELQRMAWGNDVHSVALPALLQGSIRLSDTQAYPVYRLFLSAVAGSIAIGLYVLVQKTRLGMTIRAGVDNREMAQVLGIDVGKIFTLVFSGGVALAAFSGMIAAPVETVYPAMGGHVLILSFVVAVIGGLGSIKGAFIAAMLVGLSDAFGKAFFPEVAEFSLYLVMAAVLLWRPQGLFGRGLQ